MSEKTHEASDQKIKEARKKGQIPRSKLLSSGVVTVFGLVATLSSIESTTLRLRSLTISLLALDVPPLQALWTSLSTLVLCVIPSLLGALFGAVLAQVYTAGLQFNADAVAPKFDKLNFLEGFQKLFSAKNAIEVAKGLSVAAVMGWLFFNFAESHGRLAFSAVTQTGLTGLLALLATLSSFTLKAGGVLLILGVADQALANKKHLKELMMSHEEVKQEHKNSEGDPHTKSKRKSLQKQMASGGKARGVKKATAVVVNPTHIAVAIRYDESENEAPYIVAKGREGDALKIRLEAKRLGIPVIRDVPLARSLVHHDVGEEIPEELYQAAAALLKIALEETAALTPPLEKK
jgi:type III secretion protein U